jgi:hypothetical protein
MNGLKNGCSGTEEIQTEQPFIFKELIIPDRIIWKKNVYEITYLHPWFHITCIMVITFANKISNVILVGFHPNRDPKNCNYCLSDEIKGKNLNEENFRRLLNNIKTYYYDNCYNQVGKKYIEYKKLDSIYMQFNKGD